MLEEPKLLLPEQIILELDEKKGVFLSVSRVLCTYTLEFDEESVFSFFALHCQIDDLVKKGK